MILLLLLPIAIVPLGLVYGSITAGMLIVRRHRAHQLARSVDAARRNGGAAVWTNLQHADRTLNLALLCIAGAGGALAVPVEIAAAQNYTFNNETLRGNLLLLAGVLDGLLLLILIAAIPVAAAITTKQLQRPALLAAEAYALTTRVGPYKAIRISRILWWTTNAIYFSFGVTVCIVAATWG